MGKKNIMKFSQKAFSIACTILCTTQLAAVTIVNNNPLEILVEVWRAAPAATLKSGRLSSIYITNGQSQTIAECSNTEVIISTLTPKTLTQDEKSMFRLMSRFGHVPEEDINKIASYEAGQINDQSVLTINPDNTITVTFPENEFSDNN